MAKTHRINPPPPDVEVSNQGSIFMVYPMTQAAKDWVTENVAIESWQYLGPGFAVDHHYIENLISGMASDGLVVS
jgi:hypothetical protein